MRFPKPVDVFLDDAQLAAIGHYTVQWAFFETEMEFTISAMGFLVNEDPAMPFGFGDRIKHWKRLVRARFTDEEIVNDYLHIMRMAGEAHDTRTTFTHSSILGDPTRRSRQVCFEHHQHRRGDWISRATYLTPQQIRKFARDLGRVAAELIRINGYYLPVSPDTLPRKLPPQEHGESLHPLLGPINNSASESPRRSSRLRLETTRTP